MKQRSRANGPIEEQELKREEVEEWLRLAQIDGLNIFHDRNAMIVWLCKALLKEWDKPKGSD